MEVWKIIFLSKWVICRFHVNLPGCNNQSAPGQELVKMRCNLSKSFIHQWCIYIYILYVRSSICIYIYMIISDVICVLMIFDCLFNKYLCVAGKLVHTIVLCRDFRQVLQVSDPRAD